MFYNQFIGWHCKRWTLWCCWFPQRSW